MMQNGTYDIETADLFTIKQAADVLLMSTAFVNDQIKAGVLTEFKDNKGRRAVTVHQVYAFKAKRDTEYADLLEQVPNRQPVTTKSAQQRFDEAKDSPSVQSLMRFIPKNLGRKLSDVAAWDIDMSNKPSRAFFVLFSDGKQFSGTMEQSWHVAVFDIQTVTQGEVK